MVKLIVLALGVCAATLAGGYAQKQFMAMPKAHAGESGHGSEASSAVLTETGLLAVPVIANGGLEGFFFLRLAYAADTGSSQIPADLLLADGFYQFAAQSSSAHKAGGEKLDIDAVAQEVKTSVNKHAGKPVISDIFVTQIDFFASADVRKKSIERRLVLKEETAKRAPADGGHAAPADDTHGAPADDGHATPAAAAH
jgi:hypothetical protein